jgi:flagellar motility protein MotE (MotC chaperone)
MRRRSALLPAFGAAAMLAMGVAATTVAAPAAPAARVAVAPAAYPAPTAAELVQWCGEQAVGVRTLADQLRHRSIELDEREHLLSAREATIADATKVLDERLVAMTKLQAELVERLDAHDAKRDERVAGLVKMVESNRASSISPMFAALEPALAVEVLDRMNRAKAGKLLAELPPGLAAGLAKRMTNPISMDLP